MCEFTRDRRGSELDRLPKARVEGKNECDGEIIRYNSAHAFVFDNHDEEPRVRRSTVLIRWQLAGHFRRLVGWPTSAEEQRQRRGLLRRGFVVGGVTVVLLSAGCHGETPVAKTPPTIVTVAEPLEREVSDAVYFTGRTDGSEFVEVRARVSGYLTKVLFQPGTRIKQDDPLFEIDARPYRVTLEQAQAELERAKARQTRTAADLARNEKLVKSGAVSKESYDQFVGDQAEAAAAVKSA